MKNKVKDEVEEKVTESEVKVNDAKPKDEKETLWMDCWDPDNKWVIQDVSEHLEDTLKNVFKVFKVSEEDKEFELKIGDKIGDKFPIKLEFRNFTRLRDVINNFRRDGNVKGGGCVKFIRVRNQEVF